MRFDLTDLPVELDLRAGAASADGVKLRPKLQIAAYNGDAVSWFGGTRLVVDISGLKATSEIPILMNHDFDRLVGQGVATLTPQAISVGGEVTGSADSQPHIRDMLAHAQGGFKWRASIGASIEKLQRVKEGETVSVNGRQFDGPLFVARAGRLGEVSIVPAGRDPTATATIAASAALESNPMSFEQWLVQNGFENVSEAQKAKLKAAYEAETGGGDEPAVTATVDDAVTSIRQRAAAEVERIQTVEKLTDGHMDIRAQAVKEGWDETKTELAVLRASRPTGFGAPAGFMRDEKVNLCVLEAAIRLGSSEDKTRIEKTYDAQTLDLAYRHRRMGLKALIQMACVMEGQPVPALHADVGEWVRAGFTTTSLPTILGNVANKLLQSAFTSVDRNAAKVCKRLTANDFKTHTGARLAASGTMSKVGSGGELKKTTLSETNFTYGIDTFGRMIGLTRQQWINDDLGAFTDIPLIIGRQASLAIESIAWALVEASNGTFFAAGNNNVISGATSALGITGLDNAVVAVRGLKDSEGNPIAVRPRYLVVPPALEGEARRIYSSDVLIATGLTNTTKLGAAANTYRGTFEPVVPVHLTSSAVWYLFGDPMDVAAFGIAYLNGVEEPTVEEVPAGPEYLGRVFRGFIDFGVCTIDPQGAIRSAGQ